jgi:hypothetical protein
MDLPGLHALAGNIKRSVQRLHEAYPTDPIVATMHANLEALDAFGETNVPGYVRQYDGTPK